MEVVRAAAACRTREEGAPVPRARGARAAGAAVRETGAAPVGEPELLAALAAARAGKNARGTGAGRRARSTAPAPAAAARAATPAPPPSVRVHAELLDRFLSSVGEVILSSSQLRTAAHAGGMLTRAGISAGLDRMEPRGGRAAARARSGCAPRRSCAWWRRCRAWRATWRGARASASRCCWRARSSSSTAPSSTGSPTRCAPGAQRRRPRPGDARGARRGGQARDRRGGDLGAPRARRDPHRGRDDGRGIDLERCARARWRPACCTPTWPTTCRRRSSRR